MESKKKEKRKKVKCYFLRKCFSQYAIGIVVRISTSSNLLFTRKNWPDFHYKGFACVNLRTTTTIIITHFPNAALLFLQSLLPIFEKEKKGLVLCF